jgi:hypothetical protein
MFAEVSSFLAPCCVTPQGTGAVDTTQKTESIETYAVYERRGQDSAVGIATA